jgi:DNA-binding MarR family transcriptional regulator
MPSGTHIDHSAVHRSLFLRADRRDRVLINQTDLAHELGVNKFTMSRIITQMVEAGRMHQITKNKYQRGYFKVTDPQEWQDLHGDPRDDE